MRTENEAVFPRFFAESQKVAQRCYKQREKRYSHNRNNRTQKQGDEL